ncbi:hypothetical protein [Paracoccus sp. (in: a-proteobacteria)]|uniref:hypothetical protein n=1 Tax=Paracoccus sp. TaxID=267 RepID=UPI002AFF1682|nr:hypothetical protein [Paracoccus sp. (in: a-proteobacteria)]
MHTMTLERPGTLVWPEPADRNPIPSRPIPSRSVPLGRRLPALREANPAFNDLWSYRLDGVAAHAMNCRAW